MSPQYLMSTTTRPALPPIASRSEWLVARKRLLVREKELTRLRDSLSAERRRLPMVPVEKRYTFADSKGRYDLATLFAGRRQLYVHHFMWNATTRTHCPGCSGAADMVFDNPKFREHLADRDTTFVAISRAPVAEIEPYRASHGWSFPWYSSEGTDFNYDFHVTLDESRAPVEYNYRNKEELMASGIDAADLREDWTVNSVFLRDGDRVYHTYSAFARGLDHLFTPYNFLDLTPYGRQEDWEDSPDGWPQRPTYG